MDASSPSPYKSRKASTQKKPTFINCASLALQKSKKMTIVENGLKRQVSNLQLLPTAKDKCDSEVETGEPRVNCLFSQQEEDEILIDGDDYGDEYGGEEEINDDENGEDYPMYNDEGQLREEEMMHDMMDIEEEDEEEGDEILPQSSHKRRNRDFDEMMNDSSDDDRNKYNDDLRE